MFGVGAEFVETANAAKVVADAFMDQTGCCLGRIHLHAADGIASFFGRRRLGANHPERYRVFRPRWRLHKGVPYLRTKSYL